MRVKSRITLLMLRRLLPVLCLLAFLSGCREASYPPVLVQADSAYVQGDYELADSLLDAYDATTIAADKHLSMYYHLLTLERKFVAGKLTEEDFSLADSLCRYYQDITPKENYAKALLFRGDVYLSVKDYPKALKNYMEAADIAERFPLQCWAAQCEGDVYYKQEMYDECKVPYRRFSIISQANCDTLRMAHAAMRMGTVYTLEDEVDSTIASYEKAMKLSNYLHVKNDIFGVARFHLCDIYIQLGEYEKARILMPHDSLNRRNWADWHFEQNHLDSAKKYYIELLKYASLYGQASHLRTLSQIEMKQGNAESALNYSMRCKQIEDSIRDISQVEETRLTAVRHKFSLLTDERDRIYRQKQIAQFLLVMISAVLIIAIVIISFKWKSNERKKRQLDIQLRQLRQEIGTGVAVDNSVLLQHDSSYLIDQFHKKPLYLHIRRHAAENGFRLNAEEWELLGRDIDEAYDNFSYRLSDITSLSEQELHVCFLIKIGLAPSEIAQILCTSRNSISMLRSRLYKKLTKEKGTPKQLDEFICSF